MLDSKVVKTTAGKIPRHKGLMKKKAALRPTTPSNIAFYYLHYSYVVLHVSGGKSSTTEGVVPDIDFKKLHEAHFSKMESIDSYVQRKNKQMEVLRNSVKDLKVCCSLCAPHLVMQCYCSYIWINKMQCDVL